MVHPELPGANGEYSAAGLLSFVRHPLGPCNPHKLQCEAVPDDLLETLVAVILFCSTGRHNIARIMDLHDAAAICCPSASIYDRRHIVLAKFGMNVLHLIVLLLEGLHHFNRLHQHHVCCSLSAAACVGVPALEFHRSTQVQHTDAIVGIASHHTAGEFRILPASALWYDTATQYQAHSLYHTRKYYQPHLRSVYCTGIDRYRANGHVYGIADNLEATFFQTHALTCLPAGCDLSARAVEWLQCCG